MTTLRHSTSFWLATSALTVLTAVPAAAQDQAVTTAQAEPAGPPAPEEDTIVITGSQIHGAQVDDVLPVTVLNEQAIETTGAATGEELMSSIPQVGTVAFNEQNTTGGINGARGDIASINLRDLGTGNTLSLINGRRMVLHPGFQTELLVPVVSADANEIAPGSVRRLEVLRDGASAVYGADAVAGVVNTILRSNRTGGFLSVDYRNAEGNSLYNIGVNGGYGFDIAKGRGNITVYGGYYHENGAPTSILENSRSSDRRPLLEGTIWEGDTQFNNLSTSTPWGQFDIQAPSGATPIGDDDFYLQPDTLSGCDMDFGNGVCANSGSSPGVNTRYDINADESLYSEKNRYNAALLFNYEVSPTAEFYFEGSYYRSESTRNNESAAILSAVPIGISRDAYWNPFGPVGSPNRLPGTTISDSGADIIWERYRFIDFGPRVVTVNKDVYRLVAGLKGELGPWDFDTGVVYSEANATDVTRGRQSLTLIQDAVNRTTSDAYNPFNGACLDNPNVGDCTPNPQSLIDELSIDVYRKGKTTLFLTDFKVSRPDLFSMWAGDIGVAAGVEFRRESFVDDRDPRLDGTITFTDSVTGDFNGSDVVGSSPSPDTSGNRKVYSAYLEALVPLVSPEMNVPLVHDFNVQLAGRFEHFSDTGSTAVPRVAASWTLVPGLMLRGAWSRGFRAPNLVQVNDEGTTRVNTRDDFVTCQAQVEKGIISDLGACAGTGTTSFRFGTDQLKPEKSESINLGVVIAPDVLPGLTLTADYWELDQRGIVGVFGDDNAIALDLLLRQQGSSNPNVIRNAPDADQIALFTGTSLEPAGSIDRVLDQYLNLDSRKSKGWDFGAYYELETNSIGDFDFRFNAARLKSFFQSAGPDGQLLLDAIAAGTLPTAVAIDGLGELLEIEGRPKWRFSTAINWESGPVRVEWFGRYVGKVYDTSATQDDTGDFWEVDDYFTMNAAVSYEFDNGGLLDGTRIKLGVINLLDEAPPLADENYGYFTELHSGRGRQWRLQLRKTF